MLTHSWVFLSKAIKKRKLYGKLPVTQLMKSIDSAINLKQILNTKEQEGLNGHTLFFNQPYMCLTVFKLCYFLFFKMDT